VWYQHKQSIHYYIIERYTGNDSESSSVDSDYEGGSDSSLVIK